MYSAILKLDNNCQGCDRLAGSYQPQDDVIAKLSRVTMPNLPQLTNNSNVHTMVSLTGMLNLVLGLYTVNGTELKQKLYHNFFAFVYPSICNSTHRNGPVGSEVKTCIFIILFFQLNFGAKLFEIGHYFLMMSLQYGEKLILRKHVF